MPVAADLLVRLREATGALALVGGGVRGRSSSSCGACAAGGRGRCESRGGGGRGGRWAFWARSACWSMARPTVRSSSRSGPAGRPSGRWTGSRSACGRSWLVPMVCCGSRCGWSDRRHRCALADASDPGWSWAVRLQEEDAPAVERAVRRAAAGAAVTVVYRVVEDDGVARRVRERLRRRELDGVAPFVIDGLIELEPEAEDDALRAGGVVMRIAQLVAEGASRADVAVQATELIAEGYDLARVVVVLDDDADARRRFGGRERAASAEPVVEVAIEAEAERGVLVVQPCAGRVAPECRGGGRDGRIGAAPHRDARPARARRDDRRSDRAAESAQLRCGARGGVRASARQRRVGGTCLARHRSLQARQRSERPSGGRRGAASRRRRARRRRYGRAGRRACGRGGVRDPHA